MYEIVSPQSVGYLVHIHAAGGCVEYLLVQPALTIDLCRCAVLHGVAGIEHIERIGVDYLPDVVADNNHCATLLDGIDGSLYLLRGDSVEAGRRLVQEYDGGILQEHAGNGNPLLLAAAQLQGIGLEPAGQCHNLVIDIRLPCGLLCRAACSTSSRVADGLP